MRYNSSKTRMAKEGTLVLDVADVPESVWDTVVITYETEDED